jgi:hypothetical protein
VLRTATCPASLAGTLSAIMWFDLVYTSFFDTRGFAFELTQIKQFGAPHQTTPDNFDIINFGRMYGENAFDSHPIGHFADDKGPPCPAAADSDHNPFKSLDTLARAFDDAHMHAYRIPGAEFGEILLHLGLFKWYKGMHNFVPYLKRFQQSE